jgi:hypothetical protein
MAAIYSNGGNRWNILGFNFTKRDALSSVYTAISIKVVPRAKRKSRIRARKAAGNRYKSIHLLAIPSSLSRSYSTFPLCSGDNLNWNSCIRYLGLNPWINNNTDKHAVIVSYLDLFSLLSYIDHKYTPCHHNTVHSEYKQRSLSSSPRTWTCDRMILDFSWYNLL